MTYCNEDCFAYSEPNGVPRCSVLNHIKCENCKTYKTWEQVYEQQKACKKRLADRLPNVTYQITVPKKILAILEEEDDD